MTYGMNPFGSINMKKALQVVGDSNYLRKKRIEFLKNRERYLETSTKMTESHREMEYILLRIERKLFFNDIEPRIHRRIMSEKPVIPENGDLVAHNYETNLKKVNDGFNATHKQYTNTTNLSTIETMKANQSIFDQQPLETLKIRKKYPCLYLNCEKSYKNANGLKYHLKYGHTLNPIVKQFRCDVEGCIKSYKSINGLQYHKINEHKHKKIFKYYDSDDTFY
ncbi:hypothetical protein CWI39_0087p0050 [Hamiltosporidium magnivora]|uniref:C2H2-type domain-containing protein n=1 Tax=Hamiltosporidium magnivora TaxID=148818 RepID=A0A4Q9LLS3_9MICR|nr:hypothetical protein CWI39_0087p0050 [Hamiltosporidium magnivora]